MSEKKKWFDEDEQSLSIRDEAEEIHRAVQTLRFEFCLLIREQISS
jgi:hypothetical protein